MTIKQWKRQAQIVVGKGGNGIKVEDLRVQFEATKTVEPAPNIATIKIFNLTHANEVKIKNEFADVILNAGYDGAMQIIFRGNIKHVYRYREKTDWITEIVVGDGDKDFRKAVMNETLAAGTTTAQIVERAVGSFGGTAKGAVQINDRERIRGKVISGNTRDVLHDVARESGANWSIQDGMLTIVKTNGILPDEAVVISAETGMLGAPEINDKGIAVKCLMNPQIKVNGAIKLDNSSIKEKREKEGAQNKKKSIVRLDPEGIYKVLKITHKGDTRGHDWVSEIECVGL